VKGWPIEVRESDMQAFQELVDAGIMEPNGQDFRFTDDGWIQSHSVGRLPPLECHISRSSTASQARAYAHQVSAVRGDMPRTRAHQASVKPPK
jgi:hypothetical protein